MPKVSVVIPCYNQGQYVDEAVGSVLCQTYQDFEIIIVNDGSTDAVTNSLLSNYQKPKTRVIQIDNEGLASARNSGIKKAEGEYILPLDADDKIGKEYLEEAVNVLDGNPRIGIVYCEAEFFGGASGKWELPEYSIEEMLIDNIIFCSGLFRKKHWDEVGGYDPEMIYGWEDYDFWLSLIQMGAAVYRIPKVLFFYRILDDSMIRTKTKEQKSEMFTKIFYKHEDFYKKNIQIWIDKLIDIEDSNRLIQEQEQIQNKDRHIQNIQSELKLNMIRSSLVWQLGEFYREIIYIKLLGRFPLVEKAVLTIRREGFVSCFYRVKAYLKRNKYFSTIGR